MTRVCNPKENIPNTFFKCGEKLICSAINWNLWPRQSKLEKRRALPCQRQNGNVAIYCLSDEDRQSAFKRNMVALLGSSCCCGKEITYILWVCVCSLSYPACQAYTLYYIAIRGLSCRAIFFPHWLLNGTIFEETVLNIKCVFLTTTFVWNISHSKKISTR